MTKTIKENLTLLPLEEALSKNILTIEDIRRIFLCGVNNAQAILKCCQDMAAQANPFYVRLKGKILPNGLKRYMGISA